jgi:hypothetical protein
VSDLDCGSSEAISRMPEIHVAVDRGETGFYSSGKGFLYMKSR